MDNKNRWAVVAGTNGKYLVCSNGTLVSRYRKSSKTMSYRVLRGTLDGHGYRHFSIVINGKRVRKSLASIVLETFVGERPPGYLACHGPAGKEDNSVENLYWATRSRNLGEDRLRDGTSNRGSSNPMAKLDEIDVRFIKKWLSSGYGCRDIAKLFGVSRQTIFDIKFNRRWSWCSV